MKRRLPWALAALAFLSSLAVSRWSFARHFEGGVSFEFCHYAEIGRNIVEGRGCVSAAAYPSALAYFDARGIPFRTDGPVIDRFFLPSYIAAFFEKLRGKNDAAIALSSALQLAACAAAAVLAGALLFSPWEGLAAGLFVAFNPSFQRAFVLWGLPDFGAAFLTLLVTVLIAFGMESADARLWPAAGAAAALLWSDRYNCLLWVPLFIAAGDFRRWKRFGLCFALFALPAALYNLRWFGQLMPPTYAWTILAHHVAADTEPWLSYRVFGPADILSHLPQLWHKWRISLVLYLTHLPFWWQMSLVSPLAAVGAWNCWTGKDAGARRWTKLILAMLALQLAVFCALRYETLGPQVGGRYFLWLAPAAFLWSARGALRLAGRPGLAVFAALNLASFSYYLFFTPQGPTAYPGGLPVPLWPELAATAQAAAPGELVATNLPGQVAWYSRRSAVALPPDPRELPLIEAKHPISVILLSRLGVGELPNIPGWEPLVFNPAALDSFCRAQGFRVVEDFGTSVLMRAVRKSAGGASDAGRSSPRPSPAR